MSDLKITQLTTLGTVPDSGDWFALVDVSDTTMSASGTTKKLAASRLAYVGAANTFTQGQTITPPTGVTGLTIQLPADGATTNAISLQGGGNLTGPGQRIFIGRNNTAATRAAGCVGIANRDGTAYNLWPDASGLLRIGTDIPLFATDTSGGSVVGDQTSNIAMKDIAGTAISDADALTAIVEAAETVQRFTYKSGAYGGQEFSGIVLDGETLGRYGKDASTDYPAGRSLNDVNLFGDLVKAIRYLAARVEALEAAL